MSRLKQIRLGTRYGRLVTTSAVYPKHLPSGQTLGHVRCRCDCGTEDFEVNASSLRRKIRPTISCGCAHLTDIPVDTRYGHQVTVSQVYVEQRDDSPNEVLVEVRCDCGSEPRPVLVKNLINGRSTSCGCAKEHYTYQGLTRQHPDLYKCWTNMRERCLNPENANYKFYGAKRITVCRPWRGDFAAFVAWALDHGYEQGLTLDRIDPDADYEPNNCRWLTARANSTRAGRLLNDRDEERLAAYMQRTGKTLSQVIEEALASYLPSASSDSQLRNVADTPTAHRTPDIRADGFGK